jgi:SAM-dependent methyltransferase
MNQNHFPEGDHIYDLYTGVYRPQIIRIALALDVFSPLENGPAKAETVAEACGCADEGIRHLLDYLTSLNVLAKHNLEYSLSPDAATFLVRGEKAYSGDFIMEFTRPVPWESIQETIRSGKQRALEAEIHFAQDAWIESYRSARLPGSLEMWAKVGIVAQKSLRLRLLDIACGCAIKSLSLAKQSPGVELTCLDTPLVLEAARDLAERWGVSSQVRFLPENLLTVELGGAQYDACLLGQVTHYLPDQQNGNLFGRVYRALVPGGRLVLDVPMESAQLSEDNSFFSLLLWASTGGRAYSFKEYRSWLATVGFVTIHQLSERLVSAIR